MSRKNFLPFSPPLLGEEEIAEVTDTLRSDWITTGPKTRRFEEEFADFVKAQAALAVSSGTDAMLVGLAALGIGPGDEVITTPMTFVSTVHVIEHLGARPVLVDVQPDTLNIDPLRVREAVGPKTKALIPVHLYGHPCDMDALLEIARRARIHVLEDAAHALPAYLGGRPVGSIGDLTAFSFYATKNLTTGEGGMLTGDAPTIEQARIWSLHGLSRDAYARYTESGSWRYQVLVPGFKCNMTDIQASLGLQQLRKLEDHQRRRRQIRRLYDEAFRPLPEVEPPTQRPGADSAWHIYCLRLNLDRLAIDRDRFIEELRARKIGTSVHFIPVHLHRYYREKYGYSDMDFPVAYQQFLRLVSLPLNPRMSDADARDVIEAVTEVLAAHRRG